ISLINRLNNCKYSKVRVEATKKIFIIVSRTNSCNEMIKMVFGASVEVRRNNSNVIAWVMPYSYTELMDPRKRCRGDTYFNNATRVTYGLARVDLFCFKRRSRLGLRIWKRSVHENKQEKHEYHPFT
ncbi:hypothetical protein LOAG_14198, partial [Loa loa]